MDRRQVVTDASPGFAAIFGDVYVSGGGAEADPVPAGIESVAVDHVVAMLLRQSLPEAFPTGPAVPGAGGRQGVAEVHALLVAAQRHNPGGLGIPIVGGDGKAEMRAHVLLAHPLPVARAVFAGKDAGMVLLPEPVRMGRAEGHQVRV